jgi:hypothetical protein
MKLKYIFSGIALFGCAIMLNAVERNVAPLNASGLKFVQDGRVGQALQLNEKSRLSYDESVFNAAGGTVEMWIRPAAKTAPGKQNFLISNGTNNPSWFFWGYDSKAYNFLSRERKDARNFNHYCSIRMEAAFPENQWTHVALVWCYIGKEESLVQLYVNGKSVIDKFDQTLATASSGPVAVGWNTAGAAAPAFVGDIDELRISSVPLTPEKIRADYEAGKNGKFLEVNDTTLLYVGFDGNATGRSGAVRPNLETLSKKGDQLVEKLIE